MDSKNSESKDAGRMKAQVRRTFRQKCADLTVGAKLLVAVGLITIFVGAALGTALLALERMTGQMTAYIDKDLSVLLALNEVYAQGLQAEQATRNILLNPADTTAEKNYQTAVTAVAAAYGVLDRAARDRDDLRVGLTAAHGAWQAGASLRQDAQRLAKAGQASEAIKLLVDKETPTWRESRTAVLKLIDAERQRATQVRSLLQMSTRRMQYQALVLALIALIVGAVVVKTVGLPVVRSLKTMVGALRAVAEGQADLTKRLPVTSGDEIGQMGLWFNTFIDKLQQVMIQIRQAAGNVTTGSRQLSTASGEMSSGAQQQASSLEQTAASLEEITGTVKQNADSAKQANQLAMGSRDTAEKGGEVVDRAVNAMGEINKSSKKIADIITTIDEIAFQTNLLALNAAVEAARAGEQGRGFAVVAAEVRSLAQRSATAAKEIKGLIQDSVQKVQDGSELVNKSGQTLGEIVSSVKKVTDIIGEIAAASQEQSGGIDQVNKAVTQMDQVVQSNAAQTEELSSTAQSLSVQAQQLQALVGKFKLGHPSAGTGAITQAGGGAGLGSSSAKFQTERAPHRARRQNGSDTAPVLNGGIKQADSGFEEF
jgi:methyl-accepting chemotaxis protein